MEYNEFNNGQDHLEYFQIFSFYEIIHSNKSIEEVSIETYNNFELTDTLIEAFNKWVNEGSPDNDKITKWIILKPDHYNSFKDNFGSKYHPKVSIWSDRNKTAYFKEKLQDSFLFENYIAKLLQEKYNLDLGQYLTPEGQYDLGENALGIEIKNDTLIAKWGNVYIEYQEKSNASNDIYINSGILKEDTCLYFLIGTTEKFYIFRKKRLLEIYHEELSIRKSNGLSKRGIKFKQISTSRGYVYPVKNAGSDMISLDQMVNEIRTVSQ